MNRHCTYLRSCDQIYVTLAKGTIVAVALPCKNPILHRKEHAIFQRSDIHMIERLET